MKRKLTRWGLSVVTMASVATAVVFATGWQSAIAASVTRVLVTNGPGRPVPVNGTITISGTPSVRVGNLPTDGSGNLKVAEQGTPTVHVNNTDSNGNLKVAEQGTPNVHVQNFPSSQTVNGSVSVSNFPDAPKTVVIAASPDSDTLLHGNDTTYVALVPQTDTSAYRDVTFYVQSNDIAGNGLGAQCSASVQAGTAQFQPDLFDTIDLTLVKQNYGEPPNISLYCRDLTSDDILLTWALVGRTG